MVSAKHNHAMVAGRDASPTEYATAGINGGVSVIYGDSIYRTGVYACPAIIGTGAFDFWPAGKPFRQGGQRPVWEPHGPVFLFKPGFQNA
jgi:hypothetical protein